MAESAYEGMIGAVRPLIEIGASLQWLRPRRKEPIDDAWSTLPRFSEAELRSKYRTDANVGIRLGEPSETAAGYLHLIDLDIRDASKAVEAWAALLELWPDARKFPSVISGSGGESRHIYFVTSRPFAKKKLRKSDGFSMVFDALKEREVKKFDWEIDVLGTGSYAVLPPSIHPDTGLPYRWEKPLRYTAIKLGAGPRVAPELIESWGVRAASGKDALLGDEDDIEAIFGALPINMEDAEIDDVLANLPEDWVDDRDTWYQVGMALHHQFEGANAGFDKWCSWSKQSEKFDAKDQARVWKSFKGAKNPVRMPTLIQAAAGNKLRKEQDLVPTAPPPAKRDLSNLLGSSSAPKADKTAQNKRDDGPDWQQLFHRNEEGELKSTLHNLTLIVRNDPRLKGILAYNEFTHDLVLRAEPRRVQKKRESSKPVVNLTQAIWTVQNPIDGDLWADSHDNGIRALIEAPTTQGGYGIKVTDRDLRGAVDIVGHENGFHPVREAILSVEWDGIPRVDRLFVHYLGCDDTAYHRAASRLTLVGAVTRIFEPGHKFDFVPILEGAQGKGKSTFIATLGMNWYTELTADLNKPQEIVEAMLGSWIIEIGELSAMHKAEINTLKQAISRQVDKVRLPYARRPESFPRQSIYMGSTNDSEYLRDSTGNRRFWPIVCHIEGMIDNASLRRDIAQVWAEAYAMYRDMRKQRPVGDLPLYLSDRVAQEEAMMIQSSRQVESSEDGLAGRIMAWLDQPIGSDPDFDDLDQDAPKVYRDETCMTQIWEEMLARTGSIPQNEAMKIGKAMQIVGWIRSKGPVQGRPINEKYGKVRVYTRPKKSE